MKRDKYSILVGVIGMELIYNNLWRTIITAMLLIFFVPMGAVAMPENKVTICHYPPGNINNPQTIEIAESALNAHIGAIGHGETGLDTLGPCTQEIPEFPSIAVPVVGALAMMFFISRMKKRV